MPDADSIGTKTAGASALVTAILLAATISAIFYYAPRESTMGDVQRIVYLHVALAWCGLAGCLGMGIAAIGYLLRRTTVWDQTSQAAAEIGWLCSTLTLVTGSLWAHEAWNTWWTWEPRLTATLILWTMYAGYSLVRSGIEDPERRSRVGSVLAILALADAPLVVMATRWFRGMHPIAPEMDARMRLTLWASVISFTVFFAVVAMWRRGQLGLAERVAVLELREEIARAEISCS